MNAVSRREFLTAVAGAASLAGPTRLAGVTRAAEPAPPGNLQQQLLTWAGQAEQVRRAQYAAVATRADVNDLQATLREKFLHVLGGLPVAADVPRVTRTGRIEADDYVIEKLVYESFPGYFVSALLYKPRQIVTPRPAVLSPCGHSPVGKAADSYQILHVNLVKRGYVVLTYDPVGQAERSQFWDVEHQKSRFNLVCGEHAVLGNPLYLLGSSLATYRIWDGLRGLDYLTSLPEVDARRIGCVGNSGGGTLTAYIAALDPRVAVAAICCYITTLPRRMANRIEADPDSDPEQDIFDFVGTGIDHAGLLALRVPRPTLLGTARFDFFPIEGARESFAEGQHLFEAAGAGDRIARVEAAEKHGLTLPLRQGVYDWFGRWLLDRQEAVPETNVAPRPAAELQVCPDGQVSVSFRSRSLLPLALEEFEKRPPADRVPLRRLLTLNGESAGGRSTEIAAPRAGRTTVVLVNGNESPDWRTEKAFLDALVSRGHAVFVVDPRGVGELKHSATIPGLDYADPLAGVEANLAYNAFLMGRSLLGLRVSDLLQALQEIQQRAARQRLVVCGRQDAAWVACLTAAVEPAIQQVAAEGLRLSFRSLFNATGTPINAAGILPGLLRSFGDVPSVLAEIAPRKVLISAAIGEAPPRSDFIQLVEGRFSANAEVLTKWLPD